ncbi:hypothetical protein [Candidatus Amarobacter glycogenicus]|uniref:hypothetical protein n=1 Tax=Candidatus Amarobacter glycogenicus TaxID=3140699 RepID=UPI0031365471|nr:hypothetical protein [Dehalococcoidia bacterium]
MTLETTWILQEAPAAVSGAVVSSLTERLRNFIASSVRLSLPAICPAAVVEGLIIQHEELTGSTVDLEVEDSLPMVPLPIKIAGLSDFAGSPLARTNAGVNAVILPRRA